MPRTGTIDRPAKTGILILGPEAPVARALRAVEECDEVFILARAVPDPGGHFIVDEELAYGRARERLERVARQLRARGVLVNGVVGDPNEKAALEDAKALRPGASILG
jgi:hypothetical protein